MGAPIENRPYLSEVQLILLEVQVSSQGSQCSLADQGRNVPFRQKRREAAHSPSQGIGDVRRAIAVGGRFQSWNGLTWDMPQSRHILISLINHCGPVAKGQGSPWRNLTPLPHFTPAGARARFAVARFAVALFAK